MLIEEDDFHTFARELTPYWLDIIKIQFDGGDDFALLLAVGICALNGWLMPDWVADNFLQRFELVRSSQVKSWDEAFGKPFPEGVHLDRLRRDRVMIPAVWSRIRHLRETENISVGDALFERVGEEFNVGKTKCKELYYQVEGIFSKSPTAKS
jgi:hypothetical protein